MCQIEGCHFYKTDAAELLQVLSANKSMINIVRCISSQSKMLYIENLHCYQVPFLQCFLAIADITLLVASID